ncbi:MAG: YdeI family protein [Elusimicrobiota bacterium]
MKPVFFSSPEALRGWFERHHSSAGELLIGFHKVATGRPSLTWSESVDEALCVGWIDGVRRSLGAEAYTIRFTPRKARSVWSAVNIAKIAALNAAGRLKPAGTKAFEKRDKKRSRIYSYERSTPLPPELERELRANKKAWSYFEARPPYYRRAASAWVASAKKEETRQRRLEQLIEDSAAQRHIKPLRRP